jgi:predicted MPP superfamily phosphohydrolase
MRWQLSFILFLGVFLTLYGSLHYFFYRKLRRVVSLKGSIQGLVLFLLLIMLTAPIGVNVWISVGRQGLAALFAYGGYYWMGGLFLFFAIHLPVDVYRGVLWCAGRYLETDLSRFRPEPRRVFFLSILVIAGIMVYGTFEARRLKTEKIVIATAKLPPGTDSLRIVQVSDIHFSTINAVGTAQRIVETIRGVRPDIIVSTGDFVDRGLRDRQGVAALFRALPAPHGKYAVTGNHEFYAGLAESVELMEEAGFRMLRNEGIVAARAVNIAGVDDLTAERYGIQVGGLEEKILKGLEPERFTLLLKHRPRIRPGSSELMDLQLSGHTHGGQIFPFNLVVAIFFPHVGGLYEPKPDTRLYVSRGTGTWGPPVRFLSSPEVTLIELHRVIP